MAREKSPYLLQHAHNPVDWFPWGDEAFIKAHSEDKPIFLSIGYSTCHWCHVMEHESFEDPEVAELMNDSFISIKVDREERPDLDNVYMTVCQMLTGRGGWPMTIVMTPDKKPFFAGTYLPKGSRYGQTGMIELIPKIKELWYSRRDEIVESSDKIVKALKETEKNRPGDNIDKSYFEQAFKEFKGRYDKINGGFGGSPKFPTPHNFSFLMRYWKMSGDEKALKMVEDTLKAMRLGGIYDHMGYGFHRYSTDSKWLVPHFEKMLYDQALLSMAYLEAYQITGKALFKQTATEIFSYILREMTSSEGGFFSAEDADSEGVEGKFYIWEEEEIRNVLNKDEADLIIKVFNVENKGNFKDESTNRKTGHNIFHLEKPLEETAIELKMQASELEKMISIANKKLFEHRKNRIHPYKDDKVLTDWNGLMIAAFARGAQVLDLPVYSEAAGKAASFILNNLRGPENRLLHRYRDGEAKYKAHLDDYSFLIWGLIELYEASFESFYLKNAIELTEEVIEYFWDEQSGGFFFTPDDGEDILVRKKEIYDGAIPSGNAVALMNLLRLARFTGRKDLDDKAERLVKAFSHKIKEYPSAYSQFMSSMDFLNGDTQEIVVTGTPETDKTHEMLRAVNRIFLPNKIFIFRPSGKKSSDIDEIAGFITDYLPIDGKTTAYICKDHTCSQPITNIEGVIEKLEN